MSRSMSLLWRGSLDSCNYSCAYCPFAKRAMDDAVLATDRTHLERFVHWVVTQSTHRLQILFTPYGEALIHPWYQEALFTLSHCAQVDLVSIQTNGSGPMQWIEKTNLARLSLWITWHPSQISRAKFLARIRSLHEAGVQLSVGCVAIPEAIENVEALRHELPDDVYLWVNAHRPGTRYDDAAMQRWSAIDPLFPLDLYPQASRGQSCRTGRDVFSVDGLGDIRRCHFIADVLGNLYVQGLESLVTERPCSRVRCECYIGYSHLDQVKMEDRVGVRYLARLQRPQPVLPAVLNTTVRR